jgi:D-alanyl-lipoteichoic acid acyltransferase DltB (MBOAT superfamily)
MSFNSFEYLLFLPAVFLLYWFVFKRRNVQNVLIVVASYIFYGAWDWRCLFLIALTSLCSYASGALMQKIPQTDIWRKILSLSNILLNLGILCYFKYFNFFGETFTTLLNSVGIQADWVTLNVILPVGISFYTFQALSYTIDVYYGKIRATNDAVAFFAYISFFPQLVAGPIERATNLLPQFLAERRFDYASAVDGMRRILWGLFKKMVVADNCAMAVNAIFSDYTQCDSATLLLGAVLFAFQIYGDFSGYSDIAIGSARLLGIRLMQNFNTPYFSRDIAEFWRRWHISLTTWFRDYIYIPLGGSRCGRWITLRNTFIIFLVSGLWHGANMTFLCWGVYNALLFTVLMLLGVNRKNVDTVAEGRALPGVKEFLQMVGTFLLVAIGWVIFRADNMSVAIDYLQRMLFDFSFSVPTVGRKALLFVLMLLVVEWLQRGKEHGLQFPENLFFCHRGVRWAVYYLLFIMTLLMAGTETDFIYFQF